MSMNRIHQNGKYINSIFCILILFFVIWGSPFRFADGNNGRYLTTLYKIMDPELFASDPVVDAFGKFESLAYTGLGLILKYLDIPLTNVETVFFKLFIFSRVALAALLFVLVATLNHDLWTFILMAAWSVHFKSSSVSGESMFAPSFTHATIAYLLGIIVLLFFLHGRRAGTWLILGLSLFFHSIITVHLALMLFPVTVWQSRGKFSWNEIIGLSLFAVAFIIYWLWMTPPAFTPTEAAIFLQVKGEMGHISPFAHPITSWASIMGKILVAVVAWRLFLYESQPFKILVVSMLIGSGLALSLGFAAILTGNLLLTQLQPLRMFEWVNFLAFLLVTGSVRAAWKKDRWLGVLLITIIVLNILESLWGMAWLYFGVVALTAYLIQPGLKKMPDVLVPWLVKAGMIFLGCAAVLMLALGEHHSFESFRDPLPVFMLILLIGMLLLPLKEKILQYVTLILILITVLLGRTKSLYEYIAIQQDADYNAICSWIALNTEKDSRFVTAVLQDNNFRARAVRTSLNENQSSLYWVNPLLAQKNSRDWKKVMSAWNGEDWDVTVLYSIAEEWNADYILLESNSPTDLPYQVQMGNYYLLQVQ